MVFCNMEIGEFKRFKYGVTILILIDGFLQWGNRKTRIRNRRSHNPYFNRWFSAIEFYEDPYSDSLESQSLF